MAIATIASPAQLREWVRTAKPGVTALYHAGDLAHDREHAPIIEALADLVAAMAEADLVIAAQDRAGKIEAKVYAVTRWTGPATHSLVTGLLNPVLWRALRALHMREERMSASRAIGRALLLPEAKARPMVAELRALGLIEDEPSSRGQPHVVLTAKGRAAL